MDIQEPKEALEAESHVDTGSHSVCEPLARWNPSARCEQIDAPVKRWALRNLPRQYVLRPVPYKSIKPDARLMIMADPRFAAWFYRRPGVLR